MPNSIFTNFDFIVINSFLIIASTTDPGIMVLKTVDVDPLGADSQKVFVGMARVLEIY
jgi:hypothetical protein